MNSIKRWWRRFFPWVRVLALLLVIGIALRWSDEGQRYEVEGRARLVDGDSLFVDGVEIRLKNIDAPEGRQICRRAGRDWRCGREASRRLQVFIGKRKIHCKGREYDRHDRLLAFCTLSQQENRELNRWMVKEGWAVAFGGYRREERRAEKAGRGIWSSRFERPSQWRAAQRKR